eukprot:COSAG06_NODE_38745_length_420_cov_0.806854_1_plen_78_part_10
MCGGLVTVAGAAAIWQMPFRTPMRVLAAVGLWAAGVQSQSQGAQLLQQLPPASCSSSESSESRSENRSENRFRIQYQC